MASSTRDQLLRWAAALAAVLGFGMLSTHHAAAQVYTIQHRPAEAAYLRFHTPHFRMIYQRGLGDEARELAEGLERVYPEVRTVVGLRRAFNVPVILNHYTDRANGFVSPWPFRQEIEAVALRGKLLSPRFPNWFETVGPHELAHAAHAESGRGFGVGWILRRIGPDLARSLNLSGPRGMNEGVAVWLESRLHPGAGRLNYSLFEMEFRAAMMSDDPWSLAQMLEPPAYTRPFDRYYNGGGHLFEYLVGQQGIEFFHRTRDFYYRFPLLGYAPALWYGTRMAPHLLGRRMRRHFRSEARAFAAQLGDLTQAETIATARGAAFRRPTWLDNETLLVYASGYDFRPGFYRVDAVSGRRMAVAHHAISEDLQYSLSDDGERIYFTRYVPATLVPEKSIAEAFQLDLADGTAHRLTSGGRVHGIVEAGSEPGKLWMLRNEPQFNEWRILDGEAVGALERTSIVTIVPSPADGRVAMVANHEGRQGLFEARLEDGRLVEVVPWVVPAEAAVFDAAWSPDGRYVVFSADPGGVANIFAYDVGSGRITRLTNVPYGAIEPNVSPDGRWLAYVNYRHERYDLVRIPFTPDGEASTFAQASGISPPVARAAIVRGAPAEGSTSGGAAKDGQQNDADGVRENEGAAAGDRRVAAPFSPKPYRAIAHIRPRVAYPFLVYQREAEDEEDVSLGFGGGASVEWADPMKVWAAHTSAYYQHGTWWGRAAVRTGHTLARPSVEAFRTPSTVSVLLSRPDGVDTVRVGRDERGVGVGVQTPVVLQSNVYQTYGQLMLRGEYRQDRLFGRENETLREAVDRITVKPSVQFVYRGQRNPRDLVPNSGIFLAGRGEVDVWSEGGGAARWMQADGRLHIPLLHRMNTGIQLQARVLAQNKGGVVSLGSFLPRGYETSDTFLGRGTFVTYGIETTHPLWYVDDGLFLVPLYLKAVFAYGFVEAMEPVGGRRSADRLAVVGGGLGFELRFLHSLDFTVRIAPVYKFDAGEWDWTLR